MIEKLANDENEDVRLEVAKRADISPELMGKLANDEDIHVRAAIANRPDISPDLAEKLAEDKHSVFLESVADKYNLDLSSDDLSAVSFDELVNKTKEGLAAETKPVSKDKNIDIDYILI